MSQATYTSATTYEQLQWDQRNQQRRPMRVNKTLATKGEKENN